MYFLGKAFENLPDYFKQKMYYTNLLDNCIAKCYYKEGLPYDNFREFFKLNQEKELDSLKERFAHVSTMVKKQNDIHGIGDHG